MELKNITVKVPHSTHLLLKEVALKKNSSLSELARELLVKAMELEKWEGGKDPILDEIRKLLLAHTKMMEEKVFRLLARGAIDSGACKRLIIHAFVESNLHSQEDADDIGDQAYALASRSLYSPLEGIEQILAAHRSPKEPSN